MSEHRPSRYERRNPGLEFDRVAFFSDAVYAIAMTLLVVGIGVPKVRDEDLGRALSNLDSEIISFFIGFIVLGFYWLSHHDMISRLRAVNSVFMWVNLVYLAFVAFLPFPTAIVGSNGDQPLAFVLFASSLAAVSIMEMVGYLTAYRYDLIDVRPSPARHRHDLVAGLLPAMVFLLSVPLAFVDTQYAFFTWFLLFPAEAILDRLMPVPDDAGP